MSDPINAKLSLFIRTCQILTAGFIGGTIGIFISMCIVGGFALMILTPVFNLYYFLIFFIVGSYYSYKIIQKNKI